MKGLKGLRESQVVQHGPADFTVNIVPDGTHPYETLKDEVRGRFEGCAWLCAGDTISCGSNRFRAEPGASSALPFASSEPAQHSSMFMHTLSSLYPFLL